MSQKTSNLKLNVNYENNERNMKWLEGMDQNYEIIDETIGDFFNALSQANLDMSGLVNLSSVENTSTTLQRTNQKMSCCTVGKSIYIFGGQTTPTSIYKYNLSNGLISLLSVSLPINCYYSCCEAINKIVYIFAINSGSDSTTENISDSILKFDTEQNTIEELELKLPYKVSCASSFQIDNNIYIVGGIDQTGTYKTNIVRFNPSASTTVDLGELLVEDLAYSTSSTANKKGYIFGGKNSINGATNYIYQFDNTHNTVSKVNLEFPYNFYGAFDITINNNIYVLGGTNGTNFYNAIYKFDGTEITLTDFGLALPLNLAYACSSYCVSYGFVFGGSTETSLQNKVIKFIE